MYLIYSVIICLNFVASSCELQCVQETLNDEEFSLSIKEHFRAESGDCIWISYDFSFPTTKVTAPYKKIWFEEHSLANAVATVVLTVDSPTRDKHKINGLPCGEYGYRLKLEWGCNQTYIFPKKIRISVSPLTQKPDILVPVMQEGLVARLICSAHRSCSGKVNIYWKVTHRQTVGNKDYYDKYKRKEKYRDKGGVFTFIPTAQDHNMNITCVAEYEYNVIETTTTLTVEFPPKILNSSHCRIKEKLLVCVCLSWGNPLAPITWPWASLTDYSVSSTSNIHAVNSTITIPAADYHNTTVKCVSINELGKADIEIPLQNGTDSNLLDWRQKFDAVYPWITALSVSLNLILLSSLIIYTYKWRKRMQKKLCKEKTYTSLNMANVEQEYSVISPQPV